jgi:hypothetical protein
MRSRSATVTALGDVEAMCLTAEGFTAFVEARPRAREILRRHMIERLAENRIRLFTSEAATVERRLAFLLFELTRRRGWSEQDGTVRITLRMSQRELAYWADARPADVARYLTAWRDRGIIQTGRRQLTAEQQRHDHKMELIDQGIRIIGMIFGLATVIVFYFLARSAVQHSAPWAAIGSGLFAISSLVGVFVSARERRASSDVPPASPNGAGRP